MAGVRVWLCETHIGCRSARYAELVPSDIARSINRLRSPARRAEALVAAAFLRDVLGREVGADPIGLRFDSTCRRCGHPRHGKPILAWPDGRRSPSFSLSHTAGLVVLAVAAGEVGVDVERVRDHRVEEIGSLALSDLERVRIGEEADCDAPAAFLRLWTRKEAYLKGIGLGIVHTPARVTFADRDGSWTKVIDDRVETGWHARLLDLDSRWIAALAVEGQPCDVHVEPWSLD
jgi:4'-phosphopantetheinyl transferase